MLATYPAVLIEYAHCRFMRSPATAPAPFHRRPVAKNLRRNRSQPSPAAFAAAARDVSPGSQSSRRLSGGMTGPLAVANVRT